MLEYTSVVNTDVVFFDVRWLVFKLKTEIFGFWFWCKYICRIEISLWILGLLRFNIIAFGCKTKTDYFIDGVRWFWPIGFSKEMFEFFGQVYGGWLLVCMGENPLLICNFVSIDLVLLSWGSLSLIVDTWLVDVTCGWWNVRVPRIWLETWVKGSFGFGVEVECLI